MQVGSAQDNTPTTLGGQTLKSMKQFKYLGSIMDTDGGTEADVQCCPSKNALNMHHGHDKHSNQDHIS